MFLGTPREALPALEALVRAGHDVRGVVTRPDRPVGRSGQPQPSPVTVAARGLGLPVSAPGTVRGPEFVEELARHAPELLVVVAYGRILPLPVLRVAPHGAVNLHFSLLPKYRGAAPVQWALARGERTTGVTTMRISEGLDEGEILLQEPVEIEAGEHAPALAARLAEIGAVLLVRTLRELEAGTLVGRAQEAHAASHAPRLSRSDGDFDPSWTAAEVAARIRAFDPWPGVWLLRRGTRIRLLEAEDTGRLDPRAEPGQIVALEPAGLLLACGAGTILRISRLQPEGRRPMPAAAAVNGRQIGIGERIERPGR